MECNTIKGTLQVIDVVVETSSVDTFFTVGETLILGVKEGSEYSIMWSKELGTTQ